ncbi:hypothetical protein [Microbacterium marmarense]|uniref:DUF1700 domain-containing protein n=1 Tax=Microbacterium marmarense TaxID=3122051 RepID=A0ABU8LUT9_9MICO
MENTDEPIEVTRYLRELDAALAEIPVQIASDIRTGVEEELATLDSSAARERIAQLGDPALIAAEARREESEAAPHRKSAMTSRLYVVLASLAVAFGNYAIPLVGALPGFVLVWVSPAWRRWEKITATAIPFATGVIAATYFVVARVTSSDVVSSNGSDFYGPSMDDFGISWFGLFFTPVVTTNAIVAGSIASTAVGVWLLVRALRRS